MRRLVLTLSIVAALSACGSQETGEPPSSTAPALRVLPHSAPLSPAAIPIHPRVPTRLRAWHYDAPVVPISPDAAGVLTPPSDPTTLGWWGRQAGARSGTTLLTGHTVHTGGGEFDDLELIPLGSRVNLSGVRYKVIRVEVMPQGVLATRSKTLFRQDGEHRLLLVTCEGYDPATGHYADNVVVTAVRVP